MKYANCNSYTFKTDSFSVNTFYSVTGKTGIQYISNTNLAAVDA